MSQLGIPNSATYATSYTGIEEIMNVLPDNTGNEISAERMRNVVLTLWDQSQNPNLTEFVYTDTASNLKVGGMPKNQVFASMSLFTIFQKLFHDTFPPSAKLEFVGITETQYEYKNPSSQLYKDALTLQGIPLSAANSGFDELISFKLKWTATKGTLDFKLDGYIDRDPTPLPNPPGNPLFAVFVPADGNSGTETSVTKPVINVTNKYTFNCFDSANTKASQQVSITYAYTWYWGRVDNRNLLTSLQVRSLDSCGVTGSGGFGTTFRKTYTSEGGGSALDPLGKYIAWAWPKAWGVSADPVWIQKAGPSGFASKVGTIAFENRFGFVVDYDIWISNQSYGSKLDYLQIA